MSFPIMEEIPTTALVLVRAPSGKALRERIRSIRTLPEKPTVSRVVLPVGGTPCCAAVRVTTNDQHVWMKLRQRGHRVCRQWISETGELQSYAQCCGFTRFADAVRRWNARVQRQLRDGRGAPAGLLRPVINPSSLTGGAHQRDRSTRGNGRVR